jgi:glucosamine--fructose-6-phosphate aminotransferase (isomerizing)
MLNVFTCPSQMIESDEIGKNGATPIIMLVLDDNHAHHMRTACEEVSRSLNRVPLLHFIVLSNFALPQVKARGADLIIITDNKKLADGLDDDPIVIPSNGPLTALGAVVPLQMIAYELAMLKYVLLPRFVSVALICIVSNLSFFLQGQQS